MSNTSIRLGYYTHCHEGQNRQRVAKRVTKNRILSQVDHLWREQGERERESQIN